MINKLMQDNILKIIIYYTILMSDSEDLKPNTSLESDVENPTPTKSILEQSDVESAPLFPDALRLFLDWIGTGDTTVCSWGAYDIRQITADCGKHGLEVPAVFERHLNLKALFAGLRDCRPCGMRKALNILGLELKGLHHRGIDDALNISRIARIILPLHYNGGKLEK